MTERMKVTMMGEDGKNRYAALQAAAACGEPISTCAKVACAQVSAWPWVSEPAAGAGPTLGRFCW